jgi:hypothetical protein
MRRALLAVVVVAGALLLPAGGRAAGSGWQQLSQPAPFDPGVMILLTDGRVLVQDQGMSESGTGNWWLLTPDAQGDYSDGTWTQAASMPSGYAPMYAADAVLPDGRVIVVGGEYNNGHFVETNKGAIYDPVANTWTPVTPPKGGAGNWSNIGDAPAVVLADGRFMLGASGYSGTKDEAILNAASLTWTTTGSGKADGNGEEAFTLLPSGKVLSVDAKPGSCATRNTEIYNPATRAWTSAGLTPSPLVDCGNGEIGPQLLMDDGKVFVEGATSASAIYDTALGTWSAGPTLPVVGGTQFTAADASSALLPDGNVLFELSPANSQGATAPTHFFLFDGTSITQIADDADAAGEASNYGYMLMLPTGQVLYDHRQGPTSLELYSDGGTPDPAWAPRILQVDVKPAPGKTYTIDGRQFNGLSEGAAFGDDWQESTDYPLVQITNDATGAVMYARTTGMTNRSIAVNAVSSVSYTVPAGIPVGAAKLRVIANGIASTPVPVTVAGTPACVVPKVTGKKLAGAKSAIRNAHCGVGKVTKAFSKKVKSGRVIFQKPRPPTVLGGGAKVTLTVSKGKKR